VPFERSGLAQANSIRGNFGDTLHIFTFAIRARSKEHRVDVESEDPKRDTAVIDILEREG